MGKGLKGNHFHFYEILGLKTASNLSEDIGMDMGYGLEKTSNLWRSVEEEPFSHREGYVLNR